MNTVIFIQSFDINYMTDIYITVSQTTNKSRVSVIAIVVAEGYTPFPLDRFQSVTIVDRSVFVPAPWKHLIDP